MVLKRLESVFPNELRNSAPRHGCNVSLVNAKEGRIERKWIKQQEQDGGRPTNIESFK